MRKLLVVTLLATVLLLSAARDASACWFRCGWGCGWGCGPCHSYCCSPCWSYSCCSPCYGYCGPCWSPCYYPSYTYCYTPYYSYYPGPIVISSADSFSTAPGYVSTRTTPSTLVTSRRAADPATLVIPESKSSVQPSVQGNCAKVVVTLPADAKLSVEGKTLKTSEGQREFITPQLEAGTNYRYTIKAEVVRNNQVVTQSREVRVRAGETTRVSFDLPAEGVATASRW